MTLCNQVAACGRPADHRGHHGGWRPVGPRAVAPDPVPRDLSRGHIGDMLTLRELEVIAAIMQKGRYKDAAATLGIAEQTIKSHAQSILAKTGASSMHQVPYLLGLAELPTEVMA
jgi:DNA-binding CsgD family transcriptional regulator